ncbi:MAG: OsmC family protein [Chloroflexota bacterium]|nr:OsmC family protein [Chloroflexota bacterium]
MARPRHGHLVPDGLGFDAHTRSGHVVPLDATPELGGREHGPRPMELLLVGLAGCTGMDVLAILRKMRQQVTGYEVRVRDRRAEERPRRFVEVVVEHVVRGPSLDEATVARAVRLSAEKYCPASAALAAGCPVRHTHVVESELRPASDRTGKVSP